MRNKTRLYPVEAIHSITLIREIGLFYNTNTPNHLFTIAPPPASIPVELSLSFQEGVAPTGKYSPVKVTAKGPML